MGIFKRFVNKEAALAETKRTDGDKKTEDEKLLEKLNEFYRQLHSPYVGVEEQVKAIVLAIIAKEHVLFVSEPGTAKSSLAVRTGDLISGRVFKKQLSKFTDPAELFGPPNVRKLRRGKYETVIKGMLPEADIAFIDEIFRGGSAIRDTLLLIMNERKMFNGQKEITVPLRTVISASNFVSYDEEDQALYDRFLLRYFVSPLESAHWSKLLQSGWDIEFKGSNKVQNTALTLKDIDSIYEKLGTVDVSNMREHIVSFFEGVEQRDQIHITDRRKVKAQKIIAAHALFSGRTNVTLEDFIALKYVIPTDEREFRIIEARLEALISPTKHIIRLNEQSRNLSIALDKLNKDPSIVDINDGLMGAAKVKESAMQLLKEHSDKELIETANKTIAAADNFIAKANEIATARDAEMRKAADLTQTIRDKGVS